MRAGLRDSCTITGINPTAVDARAEPPSQISSEGRTLKIDPRAIPWSDGQREQLVFAN